MKISGKVKWFKEDKGYGYIIGVDGDTYYFEINNCINLKETFKEEDKVLFIPNFGDMDYATSVEKVGEIDNVG